MYKEDSSLKRWASCDTSPPQITFKALLSKATTTVDGGWRVSFDVSADEVAQIMELTKQSGKLLQVAVIPLEFNE